MGQIPRSKGKPSLWLALPGPESVVPRKS